VLDVLASGVALLFLKISYAVTAILSDEAIHDKLICVADTTMAIKFVGVLGTEVSFCSVPFLALVLTSLPQLLKKTNKNKCRNLSTRSICN
jgi:hypothetical protein